MWTWLLSFGLAWTGWATLVEPLWLRRRQVRWNSPAVPPDFSGLRICFVSDLHTTHYGLQERILRRLLPRETDLLILGGDIAGDRRGAKAVIRALTPVQARLGKFGVLGNMEHKTSSNAEAVCEILQQAGFQMLVNESVTLVQNNAQLLLAGVDDPYSGRPDLDALTDPLPETPNTLRLLVSHSPQIVLDPKAAYFHLVLSGHTHGGQVCLPGVGVLYAHNPLGRRFAQGLFAPLSLREKVRYPNPPTLYISSGVGTGHYRLRFCCRPELTLLELDHESKDLGT